MTTVNGRYIMGDMVGERIKKTTDDETTYYLDGVGSSWFRSVAKDDQQRCWRCWGVSPKVYSNPASRKEEEMLGWG